MMFVVKGAVNLSNNTEGELAIVSYQTVSGDHNMSFFYNKEEVFSEFILGFSDVISKLDRRPKEIVVHDRNAYLRVSEDSFELVDTSIYTEQDKEAETLTRRNAGESACIRQNALVHNFYIQNLRECVRSKSHMKQYQMQGLSLAMKLAWENPIKYDEVDIFPVDSVYADFEAMTDVVTLDYTIRDYTQPVKSVEELIEEEVDTVDTREVDEEDYLRDDELEEILEDYEEEPIEEDEDLEDEDEVEMEIPDLTPRRQKKVEPKKEVNKPKKSTTQQGKTNNQPRDKNGKFTSTKKKK